MNTTLITQHNIFNPHDRMVLPTYATHSSQVLEELLIADGFEVELYKNSELQLEPFDIKQGDIINVVFIPMGGGGGGKSILSLVAMIGLAVFAQPLAFGLGNALGLAQPMTALTLGMLKGGIMLAGGLLINAVLSPSTPSLSMNDNLSTSTTYSWDESYNKFQQGLSVPKVFGTHKITPPLISKFIETIDNKQYFNGLYAVNDGEILSISDIKINDESIDNFSDVIYEFRTGTLNQSLIQNFDNIRSDKAVSRKLTTDYVTTETNGNSVIGLTTTLLFPRGLYYAKDDGTIGGNSVKIILEYSNDNITWVRFGGDTLENINFKDRLFPTGNSLPYTTISGSETSTIRKTFKLNYLPENKYYIRAKFYENPPSGTRYGSDCYLEYITEEIGDDFIYPSTALIAIRALATDQLSGNAPKISCVVSANSSNPSLIAQQMLRESGIDTARILSSFNEWKTHCNTKGYAFNGVFDTSVTLRKALDLIGTAGRGTVLQFGSKFDVIMDRAEEIPVQSFTFGMGNILKDSFSQSFLPILDRANVIEATYYDASNNYEPTIVEVSNNNYDSVAEENRTSITLVGFTSRTQAIKHCNYLLNCNRYLTETVSLEADKDSLVCKYGSIVSVSHDVPQYGFSGRIEACTTTTVTLDRNVTLESGKSYYIQLRDNENNTDYHYVNNSLSTTDTLTFTTPLTTAYDKYDNYSFGEVGKANKLFRVLRINTAQDMTRKLELLEYNEDVYNDEGDIDVPQISVLGLSNLRATDYIRYAKDGSIETVMQLAWSGTSIKYTVSYKKATDTAYTSLKVHDNNINLIVDDTLYNIIISDLYGSSISLDYQVIGKLAKPNPITNLQCTESGNTFSLWWSYEDAPLDFKEFVILYNGMEVGRTKTNNFNYFSLGLDTKTFTVVAQDTSGNNSEYVSILHTALAPNPITNLSCTESGNTFSLEWDYIIDNDFKEFSIWCNGKILGTSKTNFFECFILGLDTKVFTIYTYDTANNYSMPTTIYKTAVRPRNVKNFRVDNTPNTRKVLSWDYEKEEDFSSFEIRMATGSVNVWENATPIHKGIITQSPFSYDYAGFKEFTLFIKAIDKGNNYSEIADRILFNVGDMNLDNILDTVCMQPTWDGTLTNGNIVDGKLLTLTDNTSLYYQQSLYVGGSFYDVGLLYAEKSFYSGINYNYVYGRKVPILEYVFYTHFDIGGNIKFIYDIDGDFNLGYVIVGGNSFYTNNYTLKYDGGNLYDDYTNYSSYSKPFTILDNTSIKWRITTNGGAMEASSFCGICDVEDKYDLINDYIIPVGGIQVPTTKSFHEIQNVLVTLQGQGIPRVISKAPSGATIKVYSTAGVDIGGVADIQYKGY